MRALIPQSGGSGLARFLPAAFSGVEHTSPVLLAWHVIPEVARSRLTFEMRPSACPGGDARRDRMSGPGAFPKCCNVRRESGTRTKADVRRPINLWVHALGGAH